MLILQEKSLKSIEVHGIYLNIFKAQFSEPWE
jgi:hypothetical protein